MQPLLREEMARLRAEDLLRRSEAARRNARARTVAPRRAEFRRRVGRGLVRAGLRLIGERASFG